MAWAMMFDVALRTADCRVADNMAMVNYDGPRQSVRSDLGGLSGRYSAGVVC